MKKLTFTNEELIILDRAIQELPFRIASPLVNRINEQLREQAEEDQRQPAEVNVS